MRNTFKSAITGSAGKLCLLATLLASPFHTNLAEAAQAPASYKGSIYVQDFTVDNAVSRPQDPEAARKLIELMSNSLVQDLKKAGYQARRVQVGEVPHDGLLLAGKFTELSKGSHAKRALIGFGSGAAKVDLEVTVVDASKASQGTVYSTSARKTSGNWPGAMIMPSLTPVKLVLTRNSAEKTIRKAAAKIVSQLSNELNQKANSMPASSSTNSGRGEL